MRCSALIVSLFALLGCAIAQPKTGTEAMPTVTLQRTPCFGACPSFSVTVTPEGAVSFTGIRFVAATGTRRKQIGAAQRTAIANALQEADLPSLRADYAHDSGCERWHTDAPGLRITTRGSGGDRSVRFDFGCQGAEADRAKARLAALAQVIQAQTGIDDWIGAPGDARGPARK